ncbi:hypothetical protein [Nocardiopsis sp. FR26]|uniref:hypothetical protein n=1 Tax=Nocardiopsis sp. FR26 TaxID=2605987 RepID=UPI001356EB20|nr:hypothetical protein [Nocardiopsis sp. FR26]
MGAASSARSQIPKEGKQPGKKKRKKKDKIAQVDMVDLKKRFRMVKELLGRDPEKAAAICAYALTWEKEVLAKEGASGQTLMDAFRVYRRRAQEALSQAASISTDVQQAVPKQREAREAQASRPQYKNRGGSLSKKEADEFNRLCRRVRGLVSHDPRQTLNICDQALSALRGRSGCKVLRSLFQKAREEALVNLDRSR